MSARRSLRIAQCLAVAVLSLILAPRPAAASTTVTTSGDGLTLKLTASSTTLTEGNSINLTLTALNGSGNNITSGGTAFSFGATTGDSTDIYGITVVTESPCVELAPVDGGTCVDDITLYTLPPTGETDHDFGVTPLDINWGTFGPPTCPNVTTPECMLSLSLDVTVTDPTGTSTGTPEPSSVLLLGSGLLGLGPLLRRRFSRP